MSAPSQRACLIVALALLLAACGQKGPLYVPGAQRTPVTPTGGAAAPTSTTPEPTPLAPGTALDPQPTPAQPTDPQRQKKQQQQPQEQQDPGNATPDQTSPPPA